MQLESIMQWKRVKVKRRTGHRSNRTDASILLGPDTYKESTVEGLMLVDGEGFPVKGPEGQLVVLPTGSFLTPSSSDVTIVEKEPSNA